jgi:excisionase family DNA binding protein
MSIFDADPGGMSASPIERRTYSLAEVAQLLGISRNSAYVAARNNDLGVPVIRVGSRMLVSRVALDRLLDGGV